MRVFFCLLFYFRKNVKKLSRNFEYSKSLKAKKLRVLTLDLSFLLKKCVYLSIYIRSVNCYWSKLKWISFGLVLICNFLIWAVKYRRCTIKIFIGGIGVVDGVGG